MKDFNQKTASVQLVQVYGRNDLLDRKQVRNCKNNKHYVIIRGPANVTKNVTTDFATDENRNINIIGVYCICCTGSSPLSRFSNNTVFYKYHGFSKLKIRGMFLNTTVFWSNLIIFCDFCKICHIECEKVFQNTGFYLHGSVRVSKNCVSGGLPVYLKKNILNVYFLLSNHFWSTCNLLFTSICN